jgi:hypothetical protein
MTMRAAGGPEGHGFGADRRMKGAPPIYPEKGTGTQEASQSLFYSAPFSPADATKSEAPQRGASGRAIIR